MVRQKCSGIRRSYLVTIYGYLREAPEASPEVTKFCQNNAKSRGEAERCLATGKLDD